MRSVNVILFIFFINIGIGIASSSAGLHLFGGGAIGTTPQEAQNINPTIHLPSPLPDLTLPIFSNPSIIFTTLIMGMVGTAALASIVGIPVLRIMALAIFGGVFWAMWSNTWAIIKSSAIGLPDWFITMITIVIGVMFFMAVIQFSSGQSTRRFE